MKGLRRFLIVLIFILLGACAFRSLAVYIDFTRHRELYAAYSAPWYTSVILTIVITLVLIAIIAVIYFVISYIIKKRNDTLNR